MNIRDVICCTVRTKEMTCITRVDEKEKKRRGHSIRISVSHVFSREKNREEEKVHERVRAPMHLAGARGEAAAWLLPSRAGLVARQPWNDSWSKLFLLTTCECG